jgi:hypothetical protein
MSLDELHVLAFGLSVIDSVIMSSFNSSLACFLHSHLVTSTRNIPDKCLQDQHGQLSCPCSGRSVVARHCHSISFAVRRTQSTEDVVM